MKTCAGLFSEPGREGDARSGEGAVTLRSFATLLRRCAAGMMAVFPLSCAPSAHLEQQLTAKNCGAVDARVLFLARSNGRVESLIQSVAGYAKWHSNPRIWISDSLAPSDSARATLIETWSAADKTPEFVNSPDDAHVLVYGVAPTRVEAERLRVICGFECNRHTWQGDELFGRSPRGSDFS